MTTVLDVVIPVHNEQAVLAAAVHRLDAHLRDTFPYPYRITVADNASTDATWQVAGELVATVASVAAVRLPAKGRGRALRQVWLASDALVLAYMDVDLSTDLDAVYPLVAPLLSGHSDLAIGTRLAPSSRVVRGVKREVVSRGYNLLLRGALRAGFSDAQCGFKAIRADVAAELLPLVQDPTWFFDTELLVLAERCGLRIHEVPVDWVDDPDSRVDVVATALDDLRGVWRVRRALRRGELPVADLATRLGRGRPPRVTSTGAQAAAFAVVGAATTLLHLGLFALLRALLEAQPANALALLVAAVANTAANRRWTFGVTGRAGAVRHQVQGLAVVALTLAMTSFGLGLLHAWMPHPPTWVETLAVAVATLAATAVKFVLMRAWVFPSRSGAVGAATFSTAAAAGPGQEPAAAAPERTPAPAARVG